LFFLGGVSAEKRNISLEQFTKDPTIKLFLMSTKLAACGLTLISASFAFIYDPPLRYFIERIREFQFILTWSGGIEDQAINRIHRIGQTQEVTIEKLIIRNTIEENILKLHTKDIGKGTAGLRKEDKVCLFFFFFSKT